MTISIIISTHGDARDVPILLGILERQRVYSRGVPDHNKKQKPVDFLAGKYLEPFRLYSEPSSLPAQIEVIVVSHGKAPESCWPSRDYRIDQILELPHLANSFGHHCREAGIKAATGDWIVLTSGDNLFTAGWLHHVTQAVRRPQVGMVVWKTVNNYWGWTTGKQYPIGKEKIERGWIDACSAMVRVDIAKKVGFPFRAMDGDADYLIACAAMVKKKSLKIAFLPQILAIHQ